MDVLLAVVVVGVAVVVIATTTAAAMVVAIVPAVPSRHISKRRRNNSHHHYHSQGTTTTAAAAAAVNTPHPKKCRLYKLQHQHDLPPCRYCDRPTCKNNNNNNSSCSKQCEECQHNFCSFCCKVNYDGIYEKTVCFECDELLMLSHCCDRMEL